MYFIGILSPVEISNFLHTGIDFLLYHLAEFSLVVSTSREIFIETFIETVAEFFIVRKFREILSYYLHVRISKQ